MMQTNERQTRPPFVALSPQSRIDTSARSTASDSGHVDGKLRGILPPMGGHAAGGENIPEGRAGAHRRVFVGHRLLWESRPGSSGKVEMDTFFFPPLHCFKMRLSKSPVRATIDSSKCGPGSLDFAVECGAAATDARAQTQGGPAGNRSAEPAEGQVLGPSSKPTGELRSAVTGLRGLRSGSAGKGNQKRQQISSQGNAVLHCSSFWFQITRYVLQGVAKWTHVSGLSETHDDEISSLCLSETPSAYGFSRLTRVRSGRIAGLLRRLFTANFNP